MATPDMEVIKEIPGYKVILKAVLKSQIQQLVEQLATSTDEESVILTASVSDGTLCHLGSDSGKVFLEDHEDIKSQFLGFCLKRHHKRKQDEQDKARQDALARAMPVTPPRYGDMGTRPGFMSQRFPRFTSPRHRGPPHTVALRASGTGIRGARHEPYPITRPQRSSLSFDQQGRGSGPSLSPSQVAMRFPVGNKLDGQIIKIEPDGDDEHSNQSAGDDSVDAQEPGSIPSTSQPASPSGKPSTPSQSKPEPSDKDDDAKSESSTSTIPNEASDIKFSDAVPPGGLSLDSDLTNLISQESSSGLDSSSYLSGQEDSSLDPNVIVKRESMTDSEMDLEITGVELGQNFSGPSGSHDWEQNVQNPMGGALGSPDMAAQQGYNGGNADLYDTRVGYSGQTSASTLFDCAFPMYKCPHCSKCFSSKAALSVHENIHTGNKPFQCDICGKRFNHPSNKNRHMKTVHKDFVVITK